MKLSNPRSRYELKIDRKAKVLDVGGGHNPHPRANVVVDKYSEDNTHRCGDIVTHKHQTFIEADGESLPFEDNEFDYVICNHVLEHVDDPHQFLGELSRVGKKGYVETPSLLGEYLHPKESHRWLILEIDNKLVLYDKEEVGFVPTLNLGELFLTYMQTNSLGYKIMDKTHPLVREIHYEWVDEVTCLTNPKDEKYRKYFTQTWDHDMMQTMFPKRPLRKEITESTRAMWKIVTTYFS